MGGCERCGFGAAGQCRSAASRASIQCHGAAGCREQRRGKANCGGRSACGVSLVIVLFFNFPFFLVFYFPRFPFSWAFSYQQLRRVSSQASWRHFPACLAAQLGSVVPVVARASDANIKHTFLVLEGKT